MFPRENPTPAGYLLLPHYLETPDKENSHKKQENQMPALGMLPPKGSIRKRRRQKFSIPTAFAAIITIFIACTTSKALIETVLYT